MFNCQGDVNKTAPPIFTDMSAPLRAVVTGASRGIGAALARRLASGGFAVVVNYASRASDADAVVAEIRAAGGLAVPVKADISTAEGLRSLFDAAETADFGTSGMSGAGGAGAGSSEGSAPARAKVHVLVQNAGVMQEGLIPMKDLDSATATRIIDVNVHGVFLGMQLAAERLADGGRIINITSTVVASCPAGYSMYAASKAAAEALTRVASKELASRKITVNAVAPGAVSTDLFHAGKSEDLVSKIAAACPMGRIGEPSDIAGIVAFLAGPESGWVTGQVIRVNGGVA